MKTALTLLPKFLDKAWGRGGHKQCPDPQDSSEIPLTPREENNNKKFLYPQKQEYS
jgi:hypothetical protein